MQYSTALLVLLGTLPGSIVAGSNIDCPGYAASNIATSLSGLSADLTLAGTPCNIYGQDIKDLKLQVEYQTDTRLHVKIYDAAENVYQVPTSVFPRPASGGGTAPGAALTFSYTSSPFSFAVHRQDTGETIFNSSGSDLIFEFQYLRLRTSLPHNPNLYGLGEHTDPLRLNTTDYTRTLWSRDAYEVPPGTNLYGNHPVYVENRGRSQTHGVFLLNSNGMDIKINNTAADGQYLEYNTLGGVIDLYFLAGPGPLDVARQYSEIAGTPAMQPYWGLGFHQCRYGYRDVFEVAGVVANYSAADIPLETMWTDIDYMDARKIFTVDPQRFPLPKVRELVDYLHQHDQHYIVMVDPAVAYQNYSAFNNGADQGIFLRAANGSIYKGVVWPGVTAFPDWFNPDTQAYWNGEFDTFFNANTGVDIDALWIDMNEASNFCTYPCSDPEGYAKENKYPPMPPAVRHSSPIPLPGFPPDFQPASGHGTILKRISTSGGMQGLPGRDLINPPYMIQNGAGSLSNKTLDTDLVHAGEGYVEYDTHNLYGTMMSSASRDAMLSRRPTLKPMIITRSTFAGAGKHVGHWLGDNAATWYDYRISIAEQLAFAAIYQVPMVGSDVCGFAQNTTETLCARWAMLGAFSPFYRNHNELGTINQEFYRWATVAEAARTAISIRYRLLDYLYTAMHQQSVDGTPLLNPLWYLYPNDLQTASVDLQFFFGSAVLVSPVTAENATSVSIYLPHDVFYDFYTYAPVHGSASNINLTDIGFTSIPLHIRGGTIIPMRVASANTTTALRKNDFRILIAPAADGTASGSLYLDDGVSLVQNHTSDISFDWSGTHFSMSGNFSYNAGSVKIAEVVILGMQTSHSAIQVDGKPLPSSASSFNQTSGVLTVRLNASLMRALDMDLTPSAGSGGMHSLTQIADGQVQVVQTNTATPP